MKGKRLKIEKLEFASQEQVNELKPFVSRLLQELGHPEAWVSDESTLEDFAPRSNMAQERWLKSLEHKLGLSFFSLRITNTIVDVANRLGEKETEKEGGAL